MNLYPALTKEQKQEIYNFFIEVFDMDNSIYINIDYSSFSKDEFINRFVNVDKLFEEGIDRTGSDYFFSIKLYDNEKESVDIYFDEENPTFNYLFSTDIYKMIYYINKGVIPYSAFEKYKSNVMSIFPQKLNDIKEYINEKYFGTPKYKQVFSNFVNNTINPYIKLKTDNPFSTDIKFERGYSYIKITFQNNMRMKEKKDFINSIYSFKHNNGFDFYGFFDDNGYVRRETNIFYFKFIINNYISFGVDEMIEIIPTIL